MSESEIEPAFDPFKNPHSGAGTGPAWTTDYVHASIHRIRSSPTVEQAIAQAAVEQVVVLHSIRRLLVWTLVIIPTLALALGIVLVVLDSSSGSSSSCGIYSTRC
ncbi:hypothetical protein FHS29_000567 [Saccharothrix tamanrassetensis]|uniref:Uncharacterized protein n=1 Tax=Saccharothrix tamanrassetensis TaxID=1051531 RepID=A0A841CCU7_9PSEU|nr:hypothetical protein [Saccharothrix tamanrassetensis]MBB5953997.1 hypothetical protein [Saccharothrix tamanrassetensis]